MAVAGATAASHGASVAADPATSAARFGTPVLRHQIHQDAKWGKIKMKRLPVSSSGYTLKAWDVKGMGRPPVGYETVDSDSDALSANLCVLWGAARRAPKCGSFCWRPTPT